VKKVVFTVVLFTLFFECIGQAQERVFQLYHSADKFYFLHEVQKGETLYSLSKSFGISYDQFYDVATNNVKSSLKVGDSILVQFDRSRYSILEKTEAIPIVYQVKPGDNLFRLSRILLGIHEDQISRLNGKEDLSIKVGEIILMGYYLPPHKEENTGRTNKQETLDKWDESLESENESMKIQVSENGMALWYEDEAFGNEKYVMHAHAIPGTYMLIYNPMNKRKVKAKVIGNIPPNTYPKEVHVLLSPGVAKSLGALDTRFYVKFRYERMQEH
jgi:hypothetical protein